MSELQHYGTGQQVSPTGSHTPSRALGKQLSRIEGGGMVRAAQMDMEARLGQFKLAAASSIGRTAQSEIAMLTQMEAELTKAVPLAGNRLEMLGNLTTLQIAEMVADDLSKLRRL